MDNEFGTLKNLMGDNGLSGGLLPGTDAIRIYWWPRCAGSDACVIGCTTCLNGCAPGCQNSQV